MVDCVSISGLMEDAAHTGNYGFVFNYTSNPPQYLISPELEGTENGISVSFCYKNCSADYPETFCVGYSTTTSDIDAFTWSDELTAEDTQWTEYTSTILTKDVKFVAIKHTSDNQLKLCLDDFIFEVPTDCSKPTGLTVDYTGGTTAQVSWTSDATAWNIDVNGTIISVTENPYTLTNLVLSTTYEVKVKADCGNGSTSSWTYPVSFTTDGCLDPLVLNYTLTDSYGDGWNGNAIQVIDENDEVIAILTLSSGASASGSLHICAQYVKFVWVKGNYAEETSWTFSNELGETLFSGIGTSLATGDVLYEIDNSEFPKPSTLMVDNVTATTANVSWNLDGRALRAELQYAKGYADSECYHYDNGTHYSSIGIGEPFSWGVMFPAGSFMGDALKKVKVYDVAEMEGTLNIYNDGANAPTNLVASKSVSLTGVDGFVEFDFNNLAIDDTKNVWVVFSFESGADYVAAASQDVLEDPNGRWVEINGNWSDIVNFGINGLTFMIRAEIGGIDDPSTMSWTTITDAASPYTLTELDPKTYYSVRVKAVYADGESEWVNDAFKTYPENEPPFNLAVTDIDYTAATFNWTGNQNSYNVQYRTTPIYEPVWVDDFEGGLGNWTIRAEGDVISGKEGWYDYIAEMVSTAAPAMSGSYVASSWSWVGEALHADNWLITPQLELGGMLIYYEQTSPQLPDSYEVLLSLTDNKNASFTKTLRPLAQASATGDWNEVRIDLSEYAGQKGYIAIHHVDTDKNYLFIDDFGLYNVVPAGEWIAATTSEPTLAVADLTSGTDYEWQVQGITEKGTTEWTESTFTTKAHAYEVTFAAGTPLADTWKVSANPAPEGQIVSLTFGAQKKVGSVEANGKAAAVGGSNRWIFLMPSEDVEVTVAYESALALNEEDDNTDILAEWNGYEANVTLTRTLLQGYNTLAVPFDVNEDTFRDINDMLVLFDMSMTMKELASSKIEDGVLTLNFQDVTSMKAGKPYLVKVTSQGLTEFPLNYADFPDAIISKDAAPVSTDDVIFVPTLGKTLVTGPEGNESNANRVLFLGANNTLLTPTVVNNPEEQSSYMKGFRGYFQLKDTAAGIRAFNLNIEGEEATGIQEIENGQPAVEGTFDLQGRRVCVQPLHKGVYIVNGKKVVKK